MRALVARLLALALVPVLVLAGPGSDGALAAGADEEVTQVALGDVVEQNVKVVGDGVPNAGNWAQCNLRAFTRLNSAGVYSIRARVNCETGYWFNPEGIRLRMWGQEQSGPHAGNEGGCDFRARSVELEEQTSQDVTAVGIHLMAEIAGPDPDPSCVLTDATLIFYDVTGGWESCDEHAEEAWEAEYWPGVTGGDPDEDGECMLGFKSFGFGLGQLPAAPPLAGTESGACPLLTFDKRPAGTSTDGTQGSGLQDGWSWPNGVAGSDNWNGRKFWLLSAKMPLVTWLPAGSGYRVHFSLVVRRIPPSGGTATTVQPPTGSNDLGQQSWTYPATTATNNVWTNLTVGESNGQIATYPPIHPTNGDVGVQIWVTATAGNWPTGDVFDNRVPQTSSGAGDLGITDPAKCRWYFGPKVAETSIDARDEPHDPTGPMEEPPLPDENTGPHGDPVTAPGPAPDEGECEGFSLTDPTSWAGAGICVLVKAIFALVKLLGQLLGLVGDLIAAVAGLVAALLEGLLDLLMALFVPDPSSWDFDGLLDQAESRPPFSVGDEAKAGAENLHGAYAGAPEDCSSVADFGEIGGESADVSCSAVQSVPGYSILRGVAVLALWLVTGLGLWKMFGQAVARG